MGRRRLEATVGAMCLASVAWAAAPAADPAPAQEKREPFELRLPRGVELFGWKLDLSGEARLRGERWEDRDLDHHADDNTAFSYFRTRVRADVLFREALRATVEVVDAREWGSEVHPRPQNDVLDLHQAYLQLDGLFGTPLMLRLGRQELDFGSRRLISAPTWSNKLRSFDAVRLSYLTEAVDIHGFLGSVVEHVDHHFNEPRHGEALVGVFATVKALGEPKVDLYSIHLLSRRDEVAGEDGRLGDHERHTVGTRLYGHFAERWTYDLEAAHQRGRYAHDSIRAWAFHADTAYTLDLPWQPTLQPLVNLATGDSDPADGRHGTFDPLFSTTHGPYGIIDFFHWKNLREVGCRLKLEPAQRLRITAEVHQYWLDEEKDAWYLGNRKPKRRDPTGAAGNRVGHEFSLVARYDLTGQLSVEGGWARFLPGPFVRHTGPDDAADFLYLQSLFRF